MHDAYPKSRPAFFAMKFIRTLAKVCAAQEIGSEAFALLVIIATTEDAAGYRRAVTWYDEQLIPLLGIDNRRQLAAARAKAVKHGWLHYEHGQKRVPGKYWVTIPDHAKDLDDCPTDEGDGLLVNASPPLELHRMQNGNETETKQIPNGSETEAERKQNGSAHFLPIPVPIPKPIPADEFLQTSTLGMSELDVMQFVNDWNDAARARPGPGGLALHSRATLNGPDREKLEGIWGPKLPEQMKQALKAIVREGTGKRDAITLGGFLSFSSVQDTVLAFAGRDDPADDFDRRAEEAYRRQVQRAAEFAKAKAERAARKAAQQTTVVVK